MAHGITNVTHRQARRPPVTIAGKDSKLTQSPKHDRTQTRRQARRRQRLDEIAQAHGFDTWAKYETAVRKRCEAAMQMVGDLLSLASDWLMSIPARPDYDPDLVISAALADIPKLLEALGE